MRIIASDYVGRDAWAYYRSTRILFSSKYDCDMFSGKNEESVVIMKRINDSTYQAIAIEIDSARFEDMFRMRAPEYIESIWEFLISCR